MIPRGAFRKGLSERLANDEETKDYKFDRPAMAIIQEAAELQLTSLMGKAFEISKVHNHVTLCAQEMKIVQHLEDLFMQKLPEHIERKPQPKVLRQVEKKLKPVPEKDGSVADEENTLKGATSSEKEAGESAAN